MKKITILLGVVLFVLLIYFYGYGSMKIKDEILSMVDNETSKNVKITIVYDNYEFTENLKTGWGFSCLVELENKTILFDTGGDSETLLYNMEKLEINARKIDLVFLSHIHGDHTGGLIGILELNPDVEVYIPKSFPESFKNEIESLKATFVEVGDPTEIIDGVYTTGEMGTWIKEQSLIIKTKKGLIIITGCSHPGILDIIKKAKEITKEDVYLVIGGFHLKDASDIKIQDIIESFRELGVKKTAPCHCTGGRAIRLFEETYRDDFIKAGVGKVINV